MRIILMTTTILRKFNSNCQRFLAKHPFAAQIFPTSLLMAASDLTGQILVEKRSLFNSKRRGKGCDNNTADLEEYYSATTVASQKVDLIRTLKFASLGVAVGPFLRLWYGTLDKVVRHQNAGKLRKTLTKVGMDQFLFAPFFIGSFMYVLRIIQGMNYKAAFGKVKDDYPTVMKTNYCIWPAAQLINFYIVPLNLQVVFVQFVALLWNTFLSLKLSPDTAKRA